MSSSGWGLAVVGGTVIEKTGLGKNVQDFILQGGVADTKGVELTRKDRLAYAKDHMLSTLKKVWIYILVGVGIGAAMPRLLAGTMAQKRPQPTNDEFAKQGGFASAVCSIKI